LSASTFTFVTTEVMPVGVLRLIANDLHRSESDIGLIVTWYAAVVLVASLPLTKLTERVSRRAVLTGTLAVFAATTLACAFATSYEMLMVARLATALTQGLFWAVVGPAAASLFPPENGGRTLARLAIGTSLAPVLGIPFGAWLGQVAGWRTPFVVMAVVNGLMCVAVTVLVPNTPRQTGAQARGARPDWRLFVLLNAGVLLLVTGSQTVWTYITPYLVDVTGFAPASLAPLLLVGGVGGVIGTTIAGRFVDRHPWLAVTVPMGLVAISLAGMFVFGRVEAAVVAAMALNGFGFSGFAATLQGAILRVAPVTVEISMAAVGSVFNAGIAGGAFLGGVLLDGPGLRIIPLAGMALAALACLTLVLGTRNDHPRRELAVALRDETRVTESV
jgi:DHA1 family L-arabinose/isopropyl-beta-D-thiogalactopyranoside export protein-like MFS transporter/DHA1 family inner membrane transport protein